MLRFVLSFLVCVLVSAVASPPAGAADVTLDALDSGFVTEAGGSSKYDGLLLAPATFNYSAGFELHYVDGGTGGPGGTAPMLRKNYFVFDLSGITDPVVGAALLLFNPIGGYESSEATETFVLAGSGSPTILVDLATMAELAPPLDPSAVTLAMGIYGSVSDTLGALPDFGMVTMSMADDGTTVTVPLSSEGLAYLNAGLGGLVVFGGEVSSVTPPLPIPQAVFGLTEPTFTSPKAMIMITTADPPPALVPALSEGLAVLLTVMLLILGAAVVRRRALVVGSEPQTR